MIKYLKTSTKLYLLVFIMSLFIVGIGFLGVNSMKIMDLNTKTIHHDRIIPVQQLTQIRYTYFAGIMNTAELLENKIIGTNQAIKRIENAEVEIKTNWEHYLKTFFTPEEDEMVKQTIKLKEEADKAIFSLKNKIRKHDPEINQDIMDEVIFAKVNPVIVKINDLVDLQIRISNELYKRNDVLYLMTKERLYLSIAISLFLATFFAYYLIKDTKSVLNDLNDSHLKVSESEEKYRYLFQNNPAFIIIWDIENLKVLEVNNEVIKKYGYSKDEWIGMSVLKYRPKSDHKKIQEFAHQILHGEQEVIKRKWTHLKKNGEEMLMEISSHKINYNGHHAVLSLAIDVTEQEKVLSAYRKSEEKFHALIDNAADAIFMVTDNGEIFDVNYAATKLLQYHKEEFLGKSVLTLHPEIEREKIPAIWDKLKQNSSYIDERLLIRKDGTPVEVEISRNMLPDGSGAIAIVRDISERNLYVKQLKASEERMLGVLQNSPIPLSLTKSDQTIVFLNDQFTKTFGYNLNDIPTVNIWWELAYPDKEYREFIKNGWLERIDKHKKNSGAFEAMEAVVCCKNGTKKNIEFHYTDMGDEFLVSFYDITERKLAELNLKKSEEKHRALIENIDDAILLIDENLEVFYQSPSVERIIGYTIDDRKGKYAIDYVHPEDREICRTQYEEAIAKPGIHTKSEYRTLHKNGYYIWIEIFIMNLLHDESINAYVIIYRDITSRKKFEEQQLLMSSIVNSSYDAIISKTTDGIITSWNLGAENILGYSANEMIGEAIYKMIPPELFDEEINIHEAILKGNSISHFETKRIKKNGELLDVSLTVSPIKDAKGNVIGASKILRDITERKRAEKQLKEHNEKLSEIAFLQSHIVRRPVANVLGIISLLNTSDPADPTNIELIPMLNTVTRELDDVISQIVEKTKQIS